MSRVQADVVTDTGVAAALVNESRNNPPGLDLADLIKTIATNVSGGTTWRTVTNNTVLQAQTGYYVNGLSRISLSLSSAPDNSDRYIVYNGSQSGFIIQQNTPTDIIYVGNRQTTLGTSGAIVSLSIGDCVEIIRVTDKYICYVLMGNVNVI